MAPVLAMADTKDARFNLRARPQEKLIIEKAAKLRGTKVSSFIIQHAVEQAKEVLEQEGVMILDDDDRQAFVNAFLEPHQPSPYMRRAINAHKKG